MNLAWTLIIAPVWRYSPNKCEPVCEPGKPGVHRTRVFEPGTNNISRALKVREDFSETPFTWNFMSRIYNMY